MKKISLLITLFALVATLASCKNYDARDGRYDRYNGDMRSTDNAVEHGIRRGENGIRRGFDNAEKGFEDVTGIR